METITICFFGFATLVVILVATLGEKRANRVKSTAKMLLRLLPISAAIQAFKSKKIESK
jgi:hypothetical protein